MRGALWGELFFPLTRHNPPIVFGIVVPLQTERLASLKGMPPMVDGDSLHESRR